jgi:hypothetical protein
VSGDSIESRLKCIRPGMEGKRIIYVRLHGKKEGTGKAKRNEDTVGRKQKKEGRDRALLLSLVQPRLMKGGGNGKD